ncbi:MAG: cell shape determination protein CcmA [Betaproteobacteria bacterium HGW-Betaproteobacteria-8]|nr:MAG: cell shape determination protein CcmA [Betaproteobacteria bacterium HGW-Betaproteobacteria-8]
MFSKNRNKAPSRIDTLVGVDTRVDGDIHFTGGLRVDGSIRGNVTETETPSTLVLSENGRIEGAITVSQVVINGKVIGPVHALQFIELQAKARVTGDVSYKSLEMHTGSVVEGKLIYLGDAATVSTVDTLIGVKE